MSSRRERVILWVSVTCSIALFLGGVALGMWILGSFTLLIFLLIVPVVVVLSVGAGRKGFEEGLKMSKGVKALREKGGQAASDVVDESD